jgi:hypothetical protein
MHTGLNSTYKPLKDQLGARVQYALTFVQWEQSMLCKGDGERPTGRRHMVYEMRKERELRISPS